MEKLNFSKVDKLKVLGLFLFILVSLNFLINLFLWNLPEVIFWFCDFVTLISAYALYFKNKKILSSVSFIILPAQFLWILYSFLEIFGFSFGRIQWLEISSSVYIISTIMHITLYPVVIYGVYKLGFDKKSWRYSILIGLFILISSYYISYPEDNINCVFYPCDLDYNHDYQIILNNYNYFTLNYLTNEILFWSIIVFFSYFIHFYLFEYFKFKIE